MKQLLFCTLIIFLLYPSDTKAVGPDGYLSIPSISLYKSVGFIPDSDLSSASHFYDLSSLKYGIAHLEHTMWNNTVGGRTVLVGHTPGGFSALRNVLVEDKIFIIMDNTAYEFEVFEIYETHVSDNTIFSVPPDEFELVLITCINDIERLIVKAK